MYISLFGTRKNIRYENYGFCAQLVVCVPECVCVCVCMYVCMHTRTHMCVPCVGVCIYMDVHNVCFYHYEHNRVLIMFNWLGRSYATFFFFYLMVINKVFDDLM